MPEGPEVKKNVDFLKNYENRQITDIQVISGRYSKKPIVGLEKFISDVASKRVILEESNCKGKFIYLKFNNGITLFSTLGMTGVWSPVDLKHSRVGFTFPFKNLNGEEVSETIYFSDIRNFGTLKFVKTEELSKKLKSLGPDTLNSKVDFKTFKSRFMKKSKKTIAEAIMDQSVIAGIGNYLKSEILYASKISPHRICEKITDTEYDILREFCHTIPRKSYQSGGATLQTYRQPNGEEGLFSRRFAVYSQTYDPLNNKIIKETTKDKRSTYWVPQIQK